MNISNLKKLAVVLLVITFFMPLLGTIILSIKGPADAAQYGGLQLFVMGVYNIPFLLASVISLVIGRSLQTKLKENASIIAFIISIVSSVLGSIYMLTWALGAS